MKVRVKDRGVRILDQTARCPGCRQLFLRTSLGDHTPFCENIYDRRDLVKGRGRVLTGRAMIRNRELFPLVDEHRN
jgi:hypothetical protein